MATPRILKNFGVFVNGRGYFGQVDEIELPELNLKVEEHRGGGMDAPIEVDMGMEMLTAKLTVSDPSPELVRLFGRNDANIEFRGSFVRDTDAERVPVRVELGGGFKKIGMGTWKAGDVAKQEFECRLHYYRLAVSGVDEIEIDVENMVRIIGGVDQLAGIRADIGM